MKLISIYSFLFFLLISTACDSNKKYNKDDVARLYVENLIAEETYRNEPDSLKAARERVFIHYNISQAEYEKIISSYSSDKEEWNEFYNLAEKYIDSLQAVEDSTK